MSILHLVRKSAFETSDFELCITTIRPNDHVVLLDDGCYNLKHPLINKLSNNLSNNNNSISIVQAHAEARAITASTQSRFITMQELVALTFKHNSVVTWQ